MPNDEVLVTLIEESLNSRHMPRRRAAELLVGAVSAPEVGGGIRTNVTLARPGLPKDVRTEVDRFVMQLGLDG